MPVPYLKNPPKVIDISVGRQLFADDFLESTNWKDTKVNRMCANKYDKPHPYIDDRAELYNMNAIAHESIMRVCSGYTTVRTTVQSLRWAHLRLPSFSTGAVTAQKPSLKELKLSMGWLKDNSFRIKTNGQLAIREFQFCDKVTDLFCLSGYNVITKKAKGKRIIHTFGFTFAYGFKLTKAWR